MANPQADDFLARFYARLQQLPEDQQEAFMMEAMRVLTGTMNREQAEAVRAQMLDQFQECPEFLDLLDGGIALRDINGTDGPLIQ